MGRAGTRPEAARRGWRSAVLVLVCMPAGGMAQTSARPGRVPGAGQEGADTTARVIVGPGWIAGPDWRARVGWGVVEAHRTVRPQDGPLSLEVGGGFSGIEVANWFGMGNGTDRSLGARAYGVDLDALRVESRLVARLGGGAQVEVGTYAVRTWSRAKDLDGLFRSARDTLYGADTFVRFGAMAAFQLDRREHGTGATRGTLLRVTVRGSPPIQDVRKAYARTDAEVRAYLPVGGGPGAPGLAVRAGGAKLFGPFPMQDAAFLGGRRTLRGWQSERFAGDASLYASVEARVPLRRAGGPLAGALGVFGHADVGRVYVGGASPGGWHAGFGGGAWIAPDRWRNTLALGLAFSPEGPRLYAGLDFPF
jgi:hypothetical protein